MQDLENISGGTFPPSTSDCKDCLVNLAAKEIVLDWSQQLMSAVVHRKDLFSL